MKEMSRDTAFRKELLMRISALYRGGSKSQLIARGLIFEQVEMPPSQATLNKITQTGDLDLLWTPPSSNHLSDPSLVQLPSSLN
jgi:hypothetical protein